MSDYVNISERLNGYGYVGGEPPDVYGDHMRAELKAGLVGGRTYDERVVGDALRHLIDLEHELIDTNLRLIAAIIDRPGVEPTAKAEALTAIARCRELVKEAS